MSISFATIATPDLLSNTNDIFMTEREISWFGSLLYLTQPIGALISGPIVDYLGRKTGNFIVNIPHLIAWVILYNASSISALYTASAFLGLGTGLMEAPINAYVGEISEPSLRGSLCATSQLFVSLGVFFTYYLGTVVNWRDAAFYSIFAPVASMIFALLVPETPVWLLSQGRDSEALQSLCYLRGWTKPETVIEEYQKLQEYTKKLLQCPICLMKKLSPEDCTHGKLPWLKKYYYQFQNAMLCKETIRPLTLVLLYFAFYVMSGLTPIRPNMVNVCEAFGMVSSGKDVVYMVGVITFATSLMTISIIKVVGKRKLAITAMLGSAACCTALSIYAMKHLFQVSSYEIDSTPEMKAVDPMIIFYFLALFTGFGVPWIVLAEVFPFKSRAMAQGFAAAGNYIFTFIASKLYIDMEMKIRIFGCFAIYAVFGFLGTIYLYLFLPETEGKSLEEIESLYKQDSKIFANDFFINFLRKVKNLFSKK